LTIPSGVRCWLSLAGAVQDVAAARQRMHQMQEQLTQAQVRWPLRPFWRPF
jgi:hypothetical protein